MGYFARPRRHRGILRRWNGHRRRRLSLRSGRPARLRSPVYAAAGRLKVEVVPTDAPPMFIVAATDDNLGLAPDSVALYEKWRAANKSVELHMYAKGGHGFGMRKNNLPTDHWIDRFAEWLDLQGFLKK